MTVHSHACLMRGKLPVPTTSLQMKKHFPRIKADDCGLNFVSSLVKLEHHSRTSSRWKGSQEASSPTSFSKWGSAVRSDQSFITLVSKTSKDRDDTTSLGTAPPPGHPQRGKNKKISAHGHSEHLISSWMAFISSYHYTRLSRTILSSQQPPPSHWEAAVGPPLEVTSSPG